MYRLNDIKISKNFKLYEFESTDSKEVKLDPELLERLQKLRDLLCRPVHVNSGYRTEYWNKFVGGAAGSRHLQGQAADIKVSGVHLEDLYHAAVFCGFRCVIAYEEQNFLHLDVRKQIYFNAPYNWIIEAKNKNKFKK